MTEQTKAGIEQADKKGKLCRECGKNPPISDRSPLCASCMQKKAMEARAKRALTPPKREKAKSPAKKPNLPPEDLSKSKKALVELDFEKYPEILEAVERLAEEEIRPLEMQILFMLKDSL